jgi:hypothetical protein
VDRKHGVQAFEVDRKVGEASREGQAFKTDKQK